MDVKSIKLITKEMISFMYGTGKAKINIDELVAGSVSTWTIEYEVGEYGIDDSGEILVARRDVCDSDIPQFEDANKPGFVKVYGETAAALKVRYVADRYIRPWKGCISIKVADGSLKKGDKIYIQYGASEGEGMGYRIQTFAEEEHLFKVLVDCAGSGNFYEIDQSPYIKVIGGYMNSVECVAPSIIAPGQSTDIRIRALDTWGNIAQKYNNSVVLNIRGKQSKVKLNQGIGILKDYIFEEEGTYYIEITDEDGRIIGKGNPVACTKDQRDSNLYWGDMHGQTKETVGTGTLDLYFSFGRDKSFLDFSAWQGNDFQVTDETWKNVCEKVKEYHEPGKFITFLGYEWSGTTPVGGDYNIYYLNDDQPIHRSYHWQIDMNKRDGSERNPLSELWKEFRGRDDVMGIPHVGGRYGNLDYYDKDFVHLLEIHSHHGTFEWFFEDALKKGLKLGIVAASDDHTCRPGLSYPTRGSSRGGFVSFDVIGGYTGVYTKELTRESIWNALKRRNCYATTGDRTILQVKCEDHIMGDEFSINKPPVINVKAMCSDIISEIEIRRGLETVYSYYETLPIKKDTIKIQWSGVRVRSRSKKANWDGKLIVQGGRIKKAEQFAFNQPDEGITLISNQIVEWKSKTSGDIDGMELELEYDKDTKIMFCSEPVTFTFRVDELLAGKLVKPAGGVNMKVEAELARQESQKELNITFEDKDIKEGLNPYWVKVVQKNGHMAWSSPMYIYYQGL